MDLDDSSFKFIYAEPQSNLIGLTWKVSGCLALMQIHFCPVNQMNSYCGDWWLHKGIQINIAVIILMTMTIIVVIIQVQLGLVETIVL